MVLSVILIAVSLSVDAFVAGIAYGIRKVRIPLVSKLVICFMSVFYSGFALIAGRAVYRILPEAVAGLAGTVILAAMGLVIILQAILKKENGASDKSTCVKKETLVQIAVKSLGITIQVIRNPHEGDIDRSGSIDLREALLLGLALSMDAIGVGVGSALAGIGSFWIPVASGIFQMLLLYMGTRIGSKLGDSTRLNKKVVSVIPGILLITLALVRIR